MARVNKKTGWSYEKLYNGRYGVTHVKYVALFFDQKQVLTVTYSRPESHGHFFIPYSQRANGNMGTLIHAYEMPLLRGRSL
jgi:hypothetical protein